MNISAFDLTAQLETAINSGQANQAIHLMLQLKNIGVALTFESQGEAEEIKDLPPHRAEDPTVVECRSEGVAVSSIDREPFTAESAKYLKQVLIKRGLTTTQAYKLSKNVTSWEEYDACITKYA